jgi:hypothetical protein
MRHHGADGGGSVRALMSSRLRGVRRFDRSEAAGEAARALILPKRSIAFHRAIGLRTSSRSVGPNGARRSPYRRPFRARPGWSRSTRFAPCSAKAAATSAEIAGGAGHQNGLMAEIHVLLPTPRPSRHGVKFVSQS